MVNDSVPGIHRPRIEAQCEQIFHVASTINKDLMHRMQNVPIAKRQVFGFDVKQLWILATLFILFTCSLVGTILFWFTNTVDTYIMKHLVLANGTEMYNDWMHPKAKTFIRVRIFNYSNVDRFESGMDERLRVVELGPYVYEEAIVRQRVQFDNDGTLTYQNAFNHRFLPHLSRGKQDDIVVVPNIMMLSTAFKFKDNYWANVASSMTFGGIMNKKPFMKVAAHRFIWGYEDSVYDLAKGLLSFQMDGLQDQLGLMAQRNGTSPFAVTVNTGQRSMTDYGVIRRVNGYDNIGQWTDECDSLSASDGYLFPPNDVRLKKKLRIYSPELCRRFSYSFQEDVNIINDTVPAYRYTMSETSFASPDKEPSNRCYCDPSSGACPPQGFYNATACAFGAPIFISRPYFEGVEEAEVKVDGVPSYRDRDLGSYIDLHPTMGFPIAGMTRIQVNIFAQSYSGFYAMDKFDEKGMFLPLAVIETGLEDKDIRGEYLEAIYMTSITVKQIESAIKYFTLLTAIITATAIFIIVKAIAMRSGSSGRRRTTGGDNHRLRRFDA